MAEPVSVGITAMFVAGAVAFAEALKFAIPLVRRNGKSKMSCLSTELRDHEKLEGHPVIIERVGSIQADLKEIKDTLRRIETATASKGE